MENGTPKYSMVVGSSDNNNNNNLHSGSSYNLFTSSMKEELELLIHREVDRKLSISLANLDERILEMNERMSLTEKRN